MSGIYAEVIGDPISHSKSPKMHRFWLEKAGIDADYRACHVLPENLATYVEQRRADPNWRGCNVTIPHKIAVMDLVEDPGNVRASIGAMNTLSRNEAGAVFGTNTDAGGFFTPIADVPLEAMPELMRARDREIEGEVLRRYPNMAPAERNDLIKRQLAQEFGLIGK